MFIPTLLELPLLTEQNKSLMRSIPDPSFLCEEAGTQTIGTLYDMYNYLAKVVNYTGTDIDEC